MTAPLLTAPLLMVATASGAALGSAAGSALMRWPDGGSVVRPARSQCFGCGEVIKARDLVPIVSWLMLRGRCRGCAGRIDARLPLLEVASALAVTAVVLVHGLRPLSGLLALGVVAVLLAVLTDLERRTIPDRLTLPLAAVCIPGMIVLAGTSQLRWGVIGWAVALPLSIEGSARLSVALGARRPIGGGDVKLLVGLLALGCGVALGPLRLIVLSLTLGGCHAAAGLLSGTIQRGDRLPFAPSIALAFLIVVLLPDSTLPLGGAMEVLR